MSDVNEIARAIVEQMNDGETSTSLADEVTRDRLEALIAAAIAAERAKVESLRKLLRATATSKLWDGLPEGYFPALAFTNGKEVLVMGEPTTEDATDDGHNCDAMGCGRLWEHVALRQPIPSDMKPCELIPSVQAATSALAAAKEQP